MNLKSYLNGKEKKKTVEMIKSQQGTETDVW